MTIEILNNLKNVHQLSDEYEVNVKNSYEAHNKRRTLNVVIGMLLVFTSVFAVCFSIVQYQSAKNALWFVAVLPFIITAFAGAFVVSSAPKKMCKKEDYIKLETRKKYGEMFEFLDALECNRLFNIRFTGYSKDGDVIASIMYAPNYDTSLVIQKKMLFRVELSSDKSLYQSILVDFPNKKITKYYTDTINIGCYYNAQFRKELAS